MTEFSRLVDLASARLGGKVLEANDEFFAPKENLLKPSKPVFLDGKYTDRGKWMDGWETRRRRTPGYDWCVIRLGLPGILRAVVVDTSFFRGNFPEYFSLEACDLGGSPPYENESRKLKAPGLRWFELLPPSPLHGDALNEFSVEHSARFTHLRLKIYPDGGVARFRALGEVVPPVRKIARARLDLAAVQNGGRILDSSDQFFSEPLNLLMPGPGAGMHDGWETRRRRGPGHDWVILRLGVPGVIERVEVDTAHFKGNFPESCSLETLLAPLGATLQSLASSLAWKPLLARTPLRANSRHLFAKQLLHNGAASHARFNIFPDGGVSRLRLFGRPQRPEDTRSGLDLLNHLSRAKALEALFDCCGSKKWAARMADLRPFAAAPQLLESADSVWASLGRGDWLAAFRHHPPIGGSKAPRSQSAKARHWSRGEQSASRKTSPETRRVLAAANQAYHAAFGYVFLICATGKTSEQILESLQQRLSNDPDTELKMAAEEQRKITRLRLEKLLSS
ncbi:MAG TPA: allantoicase [Verrucomicrobiae bacterium]|nr:allantoicase [Verrucomicrobiae bacterium]